MKQENVGSLLAILGIISLVVPVLIRCYQCDILLGIAITGVFMIASSVVLIVTSKIKTNDDNE